MALLIRSVDQHPYCKCLRSPPKHGGESARVVPWTPVARRALHPERVHLYYLCSLYGALRWEPLQQGSYADLP